MSIQARHGRESIYKGGRAASRPNHGNQGTTDGRHTRFTHPGGHGCSDGGVDGIAAHGSNISSGLSRAAGSSSNKQVCHGVASLAEVGLFHPVEDSARKIVLLPLALKPFGVIV